MDNNKLLAEIMRPKALEEFVGQEHLTGNEALIKKLLVTAEETGFFPSLILWGPPGCGKTTLARLISNKLNRPFYEFSAVNASVKEIEKAINAHENTKIQKLTLLDSVPKESKTGTPIIFIDEIHRFNKAQQDALLPHVEQGKIILFGATTENPSFEVIGPLLSRCRVIVLQQLGEEELRKIILNAGKYLDVTIEKDSQDYLIQSSNGDARVALNVLQIASHLAKDKLIKVKDVADAMQKNQLNFDLMGEEFYNTISAFHKSIRGSDPDAALYYLARMLEAGQDPLYIARRMIRAASEDIGLADPQALTLAVSTFIACERLGIPECNLALAETAVYLAKSVKSNILYISYGEAAEDVNKLGNLPIPMHIRNAPTKLMKNLGYGKDYNYYHSPTGEKLENIEYLPDKIRGKKYISERLKNLRKKPLNE